MNLTEELTKAIKSEMYETKSFQFVPSHDNPRQVEVCENEKFIENNFLDSWYISYDEQLKRHTLVLKKDNKVLSFCGLTQEGVWKGRDRLAGGFLLLRPIINKQKWQLLSNPVKFYQSLNVDDVEEAFHYREPLSVQFDWTPYKLDLSKEINKNELKKSQTAIALIASDRLKYFEKTVQSIARNSIAYDLPLFVFLDKPFEKTLEHVVEEQIKVCKNLFPDAIIVKRPRNFGCGRNIIDARRQLFDKLNYQRVFIFEDDMIISSTYIQFVLNMFDWANERYSNIGAVQGWAWCDLNREDKVKFQNIVKATYTNWWGYCISKPCWDSIKEDMYTYEKLFLGGDYKYRPHESIRYWFRLKMIKPKKIIGSKQFPTHPEIYRERKGYFDSPATGQDAATMHLFEQAGWIRLAPIANRGLYIGKEGIHMNAKVWIQHKFDMVKYDILPDDEVIKDFILYQDRKIDEEEKFDEQELVGFKHINRL